MNELKVLNNIDEYKKLRKRQLLIATPLLLIFAGTVLLANVPNTFRYAISDKTFIVIVALIMISLILFHLHNWHCPACKSYLDTGFNPRVCPRCGARLQ
jgi:hypothetical protein